MKKFVLAAALFGASALSLHAQTATTPSADGDTPAIATPETTNPDAPVEGANSFNEAQAKERFEKAGYSDITGLKLDDKGIWQAMGVKDGKPVMMGLDYQGNIAAQ